MPERPGASGAWWRFGAPAKVNLTLEVLERRPDGFHEIETTMLALDLHDVVRVRTSATPGVRLGLSGPCASPDVPADERNLAVRAARAVLRRLGSSAGLEITLEKHVPSGAGLGGGSSDAAATVHAAQRALGAELAPDARDACLAELGSDCSFFEKAASTGFATCFGRGDEVRPGAPAPRPWSLVLLAPDVHCETAEVYRALTFPLSGPPRAPSLTPEQFGPTEDEVRRRLFNRLEDVALGLHPDLRAWRLLLDEQGADHFRMSGSGSSFFGLFEDDGEARKVRERVLVAARDRGLALRGDWVVKPAGVGRLDLDGDPAHRPPPRP